MGDIHQMKERVKTDIRLPYKLVKHVEDMAAAVGIPKNAFFTVAAALLAIKLSKYESGQKRATMLRNLKKEVLAVFEAAENTV